MWIPGSDTARVFNDFKGEWEERPVVKCQRCGNLGVDHPLCSECAPPPGDAYTKNCAHCFSEFTTDTKSDRYCSLACADLRRRLMDGTIESITHGRTEGWPKDKPIR